MQMSLIYQSHEVLGIFALRNPNRKDQFAIFIYGASHRPNDFIYLPAVMIGEQGDIYGGIFTLREVGHAH